MKVCVYGAGAIGGHIAARLAKGGADVSVVARGAHLAAMQANGLTVHAHDGVMHSRPHASDDPAILGVQDAVIVTTKVPALPAVAAAIGPLLGPDTAVAFVTNGIPWWYFDRTPQDGRRLALLDPDEVVRKRIGISRTIGGVVYSAATVVRPGVVEALAPDNRVILGELDGAMTSRVKALAGAIDAGGMGGLAVPDIRAAVWAKLLGNMMNGPLCLLARASMKDMLADPVIRAAAIAAAREVMAIAAAYGFPITGQTPEDRIARSAKIAHRPSILQDLDAGRAMEIDALFTVPLQMAREAGVPTPVLDLSIALVTRMAIGAGLHKEPVA